ncbi:NGFI-A-binding protein 2 isoform X1 [Pygocentrus nattereri]|uniref:NGFI-A binding protein 2 (EGR1 binding protein 2) n=1 Tax=Pygocentrus nattereri TaxID=42514 RepID=A0A3B4BUX9_PYGNA|nr:NGFI-A-binding protein 2 isoform X1 [Pygocentrus nattereri]XP_017560218.1 NGFI-A-binding protein 2 isoform X1 [Pygocentrus nattereri]
MSLPRTLGELQLYRVLQRANLLMYYDTFIQQGGDDVQQLCEAGEEEFLEIMALVGMATKPLHVRRLQKALRDWAANPTVFNQPLAANVAPGGIPLFKIDSTSAGGTSVLGSRKSLSNGQPGSPCEREDQGACLTPLRDNGSPRSPCSQASPLPPDHLYRDKLSPMEPHWLSPDLDGSVGVDEDQPSPPLPLALHSRPVGLSTPPTSSSSSSSSTAASPWPGGQLDPETVRAVAESVDRLLRTMPQADPGEVKTLLRLNKKMAKTVGHIFNLDPHDKSKEEEIRKYSLIYGRFDSKRREGKQLTHHEMIINEAAAQFCIRDNALLLRRVELFSLARQVARECAYTSTLKHTRTNPEDCTVSTTDSAAPKRIKLEITDSDIINPIRGLKGSESVSHGNLRSAADDDSLSGESLDSLTQDVGPQLHPSSSPRPLTDTIGPVTWSRQLMQQTLMDEGLRLARMVSRDHAGKVSLGSEKRQTSEIENRVSERRGLSTSHRSGSPGSTKDDP